MSYRRIITIHRMRFQPPLCDFHMDLQNIFDNFLWFFSEYVMTHYATFGPICTYLIFTEAHLGPVMRSQFTWIFTYGLITSVSAFFDCHESKTRKRFREFVTRSRSLTSPSRDGSPSRDRSRVRHDFARFCSVTNRKTIVLQQQNTFQNVLFSKYIYIYPFRSFCRP